MGAYLEQDSLAQVDALAPLAETLGISLSQLALAWCLRGPGVSSAIVGVTRTDQLEQNVKASGVVIPPEILQRIDEIAPGPEKGLATSAR
jgi:aryl-alcohol dehydrogenase-like predicted oxidoreductase